MILRTSQAIRSVERHAEFFYERSSLEVALRFVNAVEDTLAWLQPRPHAGALFHFTHPRLIEVRRWRVQGFRSHLVIYRPIEGGIEFIDLLHAAQDVRRWVRGEDAFPPR